MVLNPELYNLGHFIKILILGLHSGPHAIVYYRTNLRDSKSLFFHFSFVCMLSDCTWKADSTVLHIALNSLHWIPFQSQFSMSVPAFPSLESLWGSAERIASTGILIAWLILEMQLPPLWCDLHHFLSCRNYPIILYYFTPPFFLRTFMYLFPFEYFNCGSMECGREEREYIYKVCHFVLKCH